MPEASFSGVSIRYDQRGSGEPALLFLPGWCDHRSVFTELFARCSVRRRTLTLDWRGHGDSQRPRGDFGMRELTDDAQAVIEHSGATRVVPVSMAHAGWVAIELRRRMGQRIPALVLLDWLILDPPPPFLDALAALQDADRWESTQKHLFAMWTSGAPPQVVRHVREAMGSYGFETWARAGRAIGQAYAEAGSPLTALAALEPPPSVLHLYSQPKDPGFFAAQEAFARDHPWFSVEQLGGVSHFPPLEMPGEAAAAIERFAGGAAPAARA